MKRVEQALATFRQKPFMYNCAQTVCAAFGREDLVEPMASCGGGEAEEETGGDAAVTDTSLQDILDKGVITVAISPDYAPYEYLDLMTGEIKGSDIVLAQYIADELGVEPYGRSIICTHSGGDFVSADIYWLSLCMPQALRHTSTQMAY